MTPRGLANSARQFLERHRSQLIKLATDIVTLLGQRVVQRLAGLISLYFVVRHLSKEDFGHYQFAIVVLATTTFIALPGLDNAVMQAASRGADSLYKRVVKFAFPFSVIGSIVIGIAAVVVRAHRPEAFGPILTAAILFPFYAALGQWKSILLGHTKFRTWSVIESGNSIFTHGLIISAVILNVSAISIYVALYLLPTSIINIVMTILMMLKYKQNSDEGDQEQLFSYGLSTSATGSISIIVEQGERILIFILISPAALAIYLAADRLSELTRSVAQDAAAVMAPRFARMETYSGDLAKIIWILCALAGLAIVLFAFALAPTVLLWLFGPGYAPSVPYAQALLCSVAIGNVGQFQFRFIRSQLDSRSFRTVTLWTSGLRLASCACLIPLFGVWGAVATVFIHRAALSLASSFIVSRRYSPSA